MQIKAFPLFYYFLYAALLISFLSISEYPLFQHSFVFSSGSRSFFSPYRLPELVLSFATFSLLYLLLFLPSVESKFFPSYLRNLAKIFLGILLIQNLLSLVESTDVFQGLLTTLTLSIIPATVLIAGIGRKFFCLTNILNKYSFVLQVSIVISFSLLAVSIFLLGNGIAGRLVLRAGPALVLASCIIIYGLTYLIQPHHIFSRPLSLAQFFSCIVFTVLGGSRGTLIAFVLTIMTSASLWLIVSRFNVNLGIFRKLIVSLAFVFPFFVSALYLFGDAYSRPDSAFFSDSYRQEQLSCLLTSIQNSPLIGHGLGSIPFCWDRYSGDVTRVVIELEFLNIYNQIGLSLIVYTLLLLLVSAHFFKLSKSIKEVPLFIVYLAPAVLLLMLVFSSLFSGSILSISNQFLVVFSMISVPLVSGPFLPKVAR